MNPAPKNAAPAAAPRNQLKAADEDPIAKATTRKVLSEREVAKARQEAEAAKAAADRSNQQAIRLAQQKEQVDATRGEAERLRDETELRAKAWEAVRRFRDVDAIIAKLELELRTAEHKAAAPKARLSDADDLKAARTRLEKEKEWRHYDEHKRAFEQAMKFLEHTEAAQKLASRKIMVERTRAGVQRQLELKRKVLEQLAESEKTARKELDELSRKNENFDEQLADLARESEKLQGGAP